MGSCDNTSYLRCLYPHAGLSWQQGRSLSPEMSSIYSAQTTFHIDGLSMLWSASHSLGRNPLRAVTPFGLIWFVAHRAKWWETLLSWPSRNKPYQIRHIGLSVLAHTMGINWSPNTTDKSIPSFPPELSGQLHGPAIWSTEHLQPIRGGSQVDWQQAQRWARKEVRERESIRKPSAAGVKDGCVYQSDPQRACTGVEQSCLEGINSISVKWNML